MKVAAEPAIEKAIVIQNEKTTPKSVFRSLGSKLPIAECALQLALPLLRLGSGSAQAPLS